MWNYMLGHHLTVHGGERGCRVTAGRCYRHSCVRLCVCMGCCHRRLGMSCYYMNGRHTMLLRVLLLHCIRMVLMLLLLLLMSLLLLLMMMMLLLHLLLLLLLLMLMCMLLLLPMMVVMVELLLLLLLFHLLMLM